MSSEVKKFLLVDSNNIDQLFPPGSKKARLEPIANRELKRLDQLMLTIVNNEDMTESEKVDQYNKTLTEFKNTLSTKPVPHTVSPKPSSKPNLTSDDKKEDNQKLKEENKQVYDATIGVDHRYKPRAKKILSLLTDSNLLKYTNTGEVILRGEKIPGSNVSDLLNSVVNPKVKAKQLIGWRQFSDSLKDANIPQSILTTTVALKRPSVSKKPHLRTERSKVKSDFDSWESYDK